MVCDLQGDWAASEKWAKLELLMMVGCIAVPPAPTFDYLDPGPFLYVINPPKRVLSMMVLIV
jgi:hypothetical protein